MAGGMVRPFNGSSNIVLMVRDFRLALDTGSR